MDSDIDDCPGFFYPIVGIWSFPVCKFACIMPTESRWSGLSKMILLNDDCKQFGIFFWKFSLSGQMIRDFIQMPIWAIHFNIIKFLLVPILLTVLLSESLEFWVVLSQCQKPINGFFNYFIANITRYFRKHLLLFFCLSALSVDLCTCICEYCWCFSCPRWSIGTQVLFVSSMGLVGLPEWKCSEQII